MRDTSKTFMQDFFPNGPDIVRILYFHPAATFGGAAKSIIELFSVMRRSGVESTV